MVSRGRIYSTDRRQERDIRLVRSLCPPKRAVSSLVRKYGNVEITGLTKLGQYTTATRPTWQIGFEFFDTTINKKVIGGASGWEVVSSS